MIRLGIIAVLGVYIDILIWPATSSIWRVFVHGVVTEQKANAGWVTDVTWTLIDGGMAVLIVGEIGVWLAAVVVGSVSVGLARR